MIYIISYLHNSFVIQSFIIWHCTFDHRWTQTDTYFRSKIWSLSPQDNISVKVAIFLSERAPACRFFVSDSTGVTAFCILGSANHPPLYSLDRISSRFMTPWVRSRPLVFFPPITANPASLSSLPYHHYHLTHLCFSLPVSSPQHSTSFALICLRLRHLCLHFIFVVHIFFVIVPVFDVLVFFYFFVVVWCVPLMINTGFTPIQDLNNWNTHDKVAQMKATCEEWGAALPGATESHHVTVIGRVTVRVTSTTESGTITFTSSVTVLRCTECVTVPGTSEPN